MPQSRRLSPFRLLLISFLIAGASYYSFLNYRTWLYPSQTLPVPAWFAAYVDVTSTPVFSFEQLGATSTPHAILSFIVASPDDPCLPSWGEYYSLDQAAVSLDLDRRLARLRQLGGQLAVSFGGARNQELSLACQDDQYLSAAYLAVITRYQLDTIDLDLENESLSDPAASDRRARVISRLQSQQRERGEPLAVWLTLPVTPQGLSEAGTRAVSSMLDQGVDLAGVNVMTMDFGDSRGNLSMAEGAQQALTSTHRQLGVLYTRAGLPLDSAALWHKLGATPMLGQNDVADEIFTLEDAVELNAFASKNGVGRLSVWSANRDVACGENYVNLTQVSDSCSGVKEGKLAYVTALSQDFADSLSASAGRITSSIPLASPVPDDPEQSPYQIWQERGAYLQGTKVVWHGNVYEAKWWTQGDLPDNPVLQAWETPWQLLGPVLPGEKPIQPPTVPPGTYPLWSGTVIYQAGERVIFEQIAYQAKWWNQGESPAAASTSADASPWTPVPLEEIRKLLGPTSPSPNLTPTKE